MPDESTGCSSSLTSQTFTRCTDSIWPSRSPVVVSAQVVDHQIFRSLPLAGCFSFPFADDLVGFDRSFRD